MMQYAIAKPLSCTVTNGCQYDAMCTVGETGSGTIIVERRDAIEAGFASVCGDTHDKRLREKLGPARDLLETVRGIGYRLVDPHDGG